MSKKRKKRISKISIILITFILILALTFAFIIIFSSIKHKTDIKEIKSKITIPDGFYYVGGDIDSGVVISDSQADEFKGTNYKDLNKLKGNQFVWIPVEQAIAKDLQEAKKLLNEGKNPIAIKNRDNYKMINYIFDSYTKSINVYEESKYTGVLEPYIVPGEIYGDNEEYIEGSTKGLYQETFNKMVESVEKNKGFYISRFEIGNLTNAVKNNEKVVSKAEEEDITYMDWIDLYKVTSKMYDRDDITTEMIWGCQWNAMLVWFCKNMDIRDNVFEASMIGNYNNILEKSGNREDNVYNNIYDLAGNAFEWSQKGNDTAGRAALGGSYLYNERLNYSLASEKGYPITYLWNEVGTRVTMYLN